MTKVKAVSRFERRKITKWETREITRSSATMAVRTFLRTTHDYGLIAVTCYLTSDSAPAETLVNMCHAGYDCWRWYEHGVVTERGAALLVNRFLADYQAYLKDRGLQP